MKRKTICVHTLVQNEARYIWYAVMSVLNYVDRVMIWDTGSSDQTQEIIKSLKEVSPKKIEYKFLNRVDAKKFSEIRQKMLSETKEDWILIVDGDEVWWDESIKLLTKTMKTQSNIESIVSRYINLIGDIYHYQDESASHYEIDGHSGTVTVRAMSRSIPGLSVKRPHGTQGYFDENNILVQERNKKKRMHILEPGYLHFTHLPRAGEVDKDKEVPKRKKKYKYELGHSFPLDYYYPEVFFRSKPDIVPSPWIKRDRTYVLRAAIESYPKKLRRALMPIPEGY